MEQTAFDFDQRTIDAAVAQIQVAAKYVGTLGGFLPDDPMGLGVLRQHVGELRAGLAVLSHLADTLQEVHERHALRRKRR